MKTRIAPLLTLPLIAVLALASCNEKKSPSAGGKAPKTDNKTTQTTPTAKAEEPDWCAEHGVPESVCTKCHPKLIAEFKQKGDWCKEHNLPESQCTICDPSLKEKFAAMAPK